MHVHRAPVDVLVLRGVSDFGDERKRAPDASGGRSRTVGSLMVRIYDSPLRTTEIVKTGPKIYASGWLDYGLR